MLPKLRILLFPFMTGASLQDWENRTPSLQECPCVHTKNCPIASPCYMAFVQPKKQALKAMTWREKRRYRKEKRQSLRNKSSCPQCGYSHDAQVAQVAYQPEQQVDLYSSEFQTRPHTFQHLGLSASNPDHSSRTAATWGNEPLVPTYAVSNSVTAPVNPTNSANTASQSSESWTNPNSRRILVRKITTYEAVPDTRVIDDQTLVGAATRMNKLPVAPSGSMIATLQQSNATMPTA